MLSRLQPNEAMTLVASIVLIPFVLTSVRHLQPRVRAYFVGTYAALLLSEVCTNLETFILPGTLNLAEHASTTIASILFALTVIAIRRHGLEDSVR